ncbi:MAG: zinc-dependent metalloprotease family protein, partial [Cyanobacteria bacterium P01_D01_bin.56]
MDRFRNPRTWIGQSSLLLGMAVVLSACSGSGSSSGSDETATTVASISQADQLVLEVQPIQVCDDAGFVCAQVELFETIVDKIWEQANIDVVFLPLNQLNDSTYLTTDENEFSDLSFSGPAGSFGRHPDSTRTDGPINLWFVDVIQTSTGLIQFGNAWVGQNGALVSDDILDFNNGIGRLDVIAHELGHNLGLRHSTLGAGDPENLMTAGGSRTIPESIDDIFPDGAQLSQLNAAQIERARQSSLVTASSADQIIPEAALVEADAVPLLNSKVSAAAAPLSIPEKSPFPLTWLLLLPLGH